MNDPAVAGLVAALPLPETIADPYPLYRELRPHTPVPGYRDYPPGTIPGGDEPVTAWVLMKHADVTRAARDHDTFSSRDPLQESSSAPTLMLVNHDNPEHDRLRALVGLAFSRKRVSSLGPWLEEIVGEMLDDLPPGDCEVVGQLTSVIPARAMLRLFGLPDADAPRCRGWATAFMLSADLTPAEREASNMELFGYFTDKVTTAASALQRGEPVAEGLIRALLTEARSGSDRLSVEEVIRFCVTLIVAGAETTTFLLANLLHNLATMPEVRRQLAADRSRLDAFIDESLRHGGPPQRLFRVATRDVDIGGRHIAAGDWVALFFAAANHDPDVFPEPERFDIERPNLRQQLSFGLGIHHCLGFALARLEAAALINAVLDRYAEIRPGTSPAVPQRTSLLTRGFDALPIDFVPRAA